MKDITLDALAKSTMGEDETSAQAYLRAIELAIVALSRHPAATNALLVQLCYAYDEVDGKHDDE